MPQPGQRISEYVLETPIGGGTFGQVWKARHHVWSDQLVAIKIPTDAQYVRNLQHEGTAIHGLVHPNIVRAIGFDPYADPPYLVMEYVPGTSLRPLIKEMKLSIDDAMAIMKQVLAGLGYAHSQGLIHRDIKPENILIHERALKEGFKTPGLVKVTDFGLGRVANTTAVGSIAYSASLKDPAGQEIAGTLDYMAPEQRSAGEIDARADLYACGVVLYEMLTGERPAGTDVPSDLNRKVPRTLDEAFKRSYARLEKRFASADEFAKALQHGPPPLPPEPRDRDVRDRDVRDPRAREVIGGIVGGVASAKDVCPTCGGKGIEPGAEWGFCDQCHGRGKLRATMSDGRGEIEVECGKCRGRGTQPPAKCHTCGGRGKVAIRTVQTGPIPCPHCRKQVDASDQFCMHCGVQLVERVRRCPKCGAYPDPADKFCIFCGQTLGAEVAVG